MPEYPGIIEKQLNDSGLPVRYKEEGLEYAGVPSIHNQNF
jgi:hypothetical protein